jgi:hypothetical protein
VSVRRCLPKREEDQTWIVIVSVKESGMSKIASLEERETAQQTNMKTLSIVQKDLIIQS